MADIAVIIVNYGTADLALAAARSVLAQEAGGHRIEVHLVDNASPGGDAAAIADQIAAEGLTGRLRFHPEATNHGFGRGNNVVLEALAARATPPDYAFLLNPDAALENGAAAVLAEFLDAHPEAGAAGAEIRNPGEVRPAAGAYRFPSLGSIFSEAVNFGPVQRLFQKTKVAMPLPDRAARVDWVSGAAVMFRMAALRQTGFFDPAYFLYFEEVDLMLRLTRAGWQVWYVPEARVMHMEGAATGVGSGAAMRRPRPAYWYQSWRTYFAKNYGRAYALAAAALYVIGGAIGVVVAKVMGRAPYLPANFFRDFRVGVIGPLLGQRPPEA